MWCATLNIYVIAHVTSQNTTHFGTTHRSRPTQSRSNIIIHTNGNIGVVFFLKALWACVHIDKTCTYGAIYVNTLIPVRFLCLWLNLHCLK